LIFEKIIDLHEKSQARKGDGDATHNPKNEEKIRGIRQTTSKNREYRKLSVRSGKSEGICYFLISKLCCVPGHGHSPRNTRTGENVIEPGRAKPLLQQKEERKRIVGTDHFRMRREGKSQGMKEKAEGPGPIKSWECL